MAGYNPLGVETYVLSSYMHLPADDDAVGRLASRVAQITQTTLTRQAGSVTVNSGVTSTDVTFPQTFYKAPEVGAGEVRVTPYLDPGVRYWVDYTTITKMGFTIKFSSAVPVSFPMHWVAEVFEA